ncbi:MULTISPECIES: glutathione S-transferase N-terminal domain-containing protein [unclassified Adlercreutzia]|uniref:glutathione S-transferase N-terminal domain-containing protein n=1 Tax=unclassified Adlercreutzia TaxID=2636013 RepID=UPI0013EDAF23|nr:MULTISPECIES: glutathione S-transferase N-terminal domain-containing protein [unclassified Adlercreutzia]
MTAPILYYWAPCSTCSVVTAFADEHQIELDKRDVEQEIPYQELLALGGDANLIPYLYDNEQLIQGNDAVIDYLTQNYLNK